MFDSYFLDRIKKKKKKKKVSHPCDSYLAFPQRTFPPRALKSPGSRRSYRGAIVPSSQIHRLRKLESSVNEGDPALESEAADEFIICGARVDARLMLEDPRNVPSAIPSRFRARNRRTCNGSDPLDKAIKTYNTYIYRRNKLGEARGGGGIRTPSSKEKSDFVPLLWSQLERSV